MGLWHLGAYDIACQYRKNFDSRIQVLRPLTEKMQSIVSTYFPWTMAAVGKFHLPAHIGACRFKFSINWLPGVGMTDGEAPERIWAALNNLARSTREMLSGHRHDRINLHHGDANVKRTHSAGRHNAACARNHMLTSATAADCNRRYARALDELQNAEVQLSAVAEKVSEVKLGDWREVYLDFMDKVKDMANHENLKNPFEADSATGKEYN